MLMRFLVSSVSAIVFINWSVNFPVLAQIVANYHPGNPFNFDPVAGNPNQDFGVVHVESDSDSGWSLQIRSQGHGEMHHSSIGAGIRYDLEIDGHTINNLSSGDDVTVLFTSRLTCPSPGGCDYAVRGRILADEIDGKPSGNYSDQLIFTLTNNQ